MADLDAGEAPGQGEGVVNQRPLPLSFERPLPPRLPEPREGESSMDYLHRCVAVGDRYWREWRERTGKGAAS